MDINDACYHLYIYLMNRVEIDMKRKNNSDDKVTTVSHRYSIVVIAMANLMSSL